MAGGVSERNPSAFFSWDPVILQLKSNRSKSDAKKAKESFVLKIQEESTKRDFSLKKMKGFLGSPSKKKGKDFKNENAAHSEEPFAKREKIDGSMTPSLGR